MAPGNFIGKVIVGLVFLDRAAEGCAGLHAGVGRIGGGAEGVDSLKFAIAQVSVNVAVEVVRSGAGDDVDHATRGASIFGGVTVADDLEFLYRLLRDGGADAVGGIVGGVGAIDVDQVGPCALSAHGEAGGGCRACIGGVVADDLRIGQGEIDIVAAVGGQIVDAALADGVSTGSARSLNILGLGVDFHDFLAARDAERDPQLGHPANRDGDSGGLGSGEARCIHGDGIRAGGQLTHAVAAEAVAVAGAFQALGHISRGDRGAGHGVALRISNADVQVAGGGALRKSKLTDE